MKESKKVKREETKNGRRGRRERNKGVAREEEEEGRRKNQTWKW